VPQPISSVGPGAMVPDSIISTSSGSGTPESHGNGAPGGRRGAHRASVLQLSSHVGTTRWRWWRLYKIYKESFNCPAPPRRSIKSEYESHAGTPGRCSRIVRRQLLQGLHQSAASRDGWMTQAGSFGIPSNGVRAVPCRHRDGEPMERVRQTSSG
jgi:hypothetical protein